MWPAAPPTRPSSLARTAGRAATREKRECFRGRRPRDCDCDGADAVLDDAVTDTTNGSLGLSETAAGSGSATLDFDDLAE